MKIAVSPYRRDRRRGIAAVASVAVVWILSSMSASAQDVTPSPNAPSLPNDSPRATSTEPPALATPSSVTSPSSAQPNEADMMRQMMELAKLNENHKLLAQLSGTWNYTVRFSPSPGGPTQESKGTAVRKSMMDGRFFALDVSGKMQMPGADGKMKDFNFKGHGTEGYDNAKQKFVSAWMDNMGTGILMSEGTYDPGTKTFTYTGELEMIPGMKQKVREVVKIADKDHHTFEWYEDRGGQEVKTMEINYTRKK